MYAWTFVAALAWADEPPDSSRWRPTKERLTELFRDAGRPFKDEQDLADALAEFGGPQTWNRLTKTVRNLRHPEFLDRIDRLYRKECRRLPTPGELAFESLRHECLHDEAVLRQRLLRAEDAPEFEFVGAVQDAAGKPIADAFMVATSRRDFGPNESAVPQRTRSARTDARGRYRLSVKLACVDSLRVSAWAEGYDALEGWHNPGRPGAERRLDFTLEKCRPAHGTVEGADGPPLANAGIWFRSNCRKGRIAHGMAADVNVLTDERGRFVLPGVHRDFSRAWGFVRAPGHVNESFSLTPDSRTEDWTIRMKPGGKIVGKVVDERGRGVPFARLQSRRRGIDNDDDSAWADEQGNFTLSALEPGQSLILAEAEDFAPTFVELVAVERQRNPAIVELRRGEWLEGVVKGPNGQPRAGAIVGQVRRAAEKDFHDDRQRIDAATVTDGAGRFRLGPLPDDGLERKFAAWTWPERERGEGAAVPNAKNLAVVLAPPRR